MEYYNGTLVVYFTLEQTFRTHILIISSIQVESIETNILFLVSKDRQGDVMAFYNVVEPGATHIPEVIPVPQLLLLTGTRWLGGLRYIYIYMLQGIYSF